MHENAGILVLQSLFGNVIMIETASYEKGEQNLDNQRASIVLGKDFYEGIKNFYRDVRNSRYDYKVCLIRRSYVLRRLFLDLEEGGEPAFDTQECMTDGAFLFLCDEVARYYLKNGRFPTIAVIDDILIHGRAINAFLLRVEERIIRCLRDLGYEFNDVEVREELPKTLDIRVYYQNTCPSVVLERYRSKIRSDRTESPILWRDLSNRISLLLSEAGIANASFILSSVVSEHEIPTASAGYRRIATRYEGTEEILFLKKKVFGAGVKAIFTVRVLPVSDTGSRRMIPFVFLSEIGAENRRLLWDSVCEKLLDTQFREVIRAFRRGNRRTQDEFCSLVLSQSMLQSFLKECGLDNGALLYDQQEIYKIAHNYGNTQPVCDLIDYIWKTPVFTAEELDQLLYRVTVQEKVLCRNDDAGSISEEQKSILLKQMEDMIYQQGLEAEKHAYAVRKGQESDVTDYKERLSAGELIDTIYQRSSEVFSLDHVIAYLLQFMDAGNIVLSVYQNSERRMDAYDQYLKAGEQSLAIEAWRHFDYIPLLAMIDRKCTAGGLDVHQEWKKCFVKILISPEKAAEIDQFLTDLKESGQRAVDWDFNMLNRIIRRAMLDSDNDEETNAMVNRCLKIIIKQKELVKVYLDS